MIISFFLPFHDTVSPSKSQLFPKKRMYFFRVSDILYVVVIIPFHKEYLMQTNNLLIESVSKMFFRYLIPAILANTVTSIYILADTIIIGKGIVTRFVFYNRLFGKLRNEI